MKRASSQFIVLLIFTIAFIPNSYAEGSLPWLKKPTIVKEKKPVANFTDDANKPPSNPVSEEKLSPISPSAVGLIDSSQGSLGNTMWNGTSENLAKYFLTYLPLNDSSETLKNLRYRLLTTPAQPPISLNKNNQEQSVTLVELRVKQLAAMKEYDAIHHLISKIPSHSITESIHQTLVVSLMKTKHYDKACKHTQVTIKYFNNPVWQQLLALCHILQEKWTKAELAVEILKTSPVTLQTINTFEYWIADQYRPSTNEILSLAHAIIPSMPIHIQNSDTITPPRQLPLKLKSEADLWWDSISSLPLDKRLQEIGQYYNYLEANNHPIGILYWQTALTASPTPPRAITLRLLRDAAFKKHTGKVIALILFSVGDTATSNLDTETLATVIQALHGIELHDEAYALTKEFLASNLQNDTEPHTMGPNLN